MRGGRDVIHPLVKTRSFLTNAFIKKDPRRYHFLGSLKIEHNSIFYVVLSPEYGTWHLKSLVASAHYKTNDKPYNLQ